MTEQEAQAELMILRGFAKDGQSLAQYRERIAALYWEVCGKTLRQCKCKNVLQDAIIEIYGQLNRKKMNKENKATARLVAGVVLFMDGNHYTNNNLTDEVARDFLAKYPKRKDWFSVLPSATTGKEVVAEVAEMPENGTEMPPKEVKPASKASTPKKKKKTSKGK